VRSEAAQAITFVGVHDDMNRQCRIVAAVVVVVLLVAGCSAHRKRIDCNAHLTPINPIATPRPEKGHP